MPQCLLITILETLTPDGVPVIVAGFKPGFAVTDNKSGSDSQSSVSLSLKHELSLWGPNHKKAACFIAAQEHHSQAFRLRGCMSKGNAVICSRGQAKPARHSPAAAPAPRARGQGSQIPHASAASTLSQHSSSGLSVLQWTQITCPTWAISRMSSSWGLKFYQLCR